MLTPENLFQPSDPPQRQRKNIPLWTPGPGRSGQLIVVCGRYVELVIHWDGMRNVVCLGKGCVCAQPGVNLPGRQKGHFGCYDLGTGRYVIGVVTHGAWVALEPVARTMQGCCRGQVLHMTRPGDSKTGRVQATLAKPLKPIEPMPGSFDLVEQLCYIYNAPLRSEARTRFGIAVQIANRDAGRDAVKGGGNG